MNQHVTRLTKRMPPPDNPVDTCVDWSAVESALGFSYPRSFKDFVSVYGRSVWFDHAKLIYTTGKTMGEIEAFVESMGDKVASLRDNTYVYNSAVRRREKVDMPLFPEKGGLFPFMNDFSGSFYCWATKLRNPERWPVVCCFTSQVLVLDHLSVPQMFLEWMESTPRMVDLWGDIGDLPPDRIRLD